MVDRSLWRTHDLPHFGRGARPRDVDVVVVGAGITGLTAAYLLKRAGKRVAVFERDRIGAGDTGNTSAHLTYVTDLRLQQLVDRFGRDAARTVWDSGAKAIDLIEENTETLRISCGFRRVPGFLCAPFAADGVAEDEIRALRDDAVLATKLGFDAQYDDRGPVTGRPAVAYARQALFHPLRYLAGLAAAVEGEGSCVREMAEVGEVLDDPQAVIVNGETVACADVVIATHVPLMGSTGVVRATLFQTKLYPYSSYVVAGHIGDDGPPAGLYSDTSDPYYFLRIHDGPTGRYAIFGGEDHKTGQEADTDSRFARLERVFLHLLPSVRLEQRWSGQVIETTDGLPFIGQTADHQFVGTGYAGNGLTFGTVAGMMIRDAITGVTNPCRELFDPRRKALSLSGLATLLGENVDYPYHLAADRLRKSAGDNTASVARGAGKVLTIDGKRVACHRTTTGKLVTVSAVCTHLGCLVRWNNAEATWDCPCHGSRFTPEGLVLAGPAESPLEPVGD